MVHLFLFSGLHKSRFILPVLVHKVYSLWKSTGKMKWKSSLFKSAVRIFECLKGNRYVFVQQQNEYRADIEGVVDQTQVQ